MNIALVWVSYSAEVNPHICLNVTAFRQDETSKQLRK